MRTLGAHQPNFLPWLPYFAKMASCEVFVLLDDVQFPKNCWVNRVLRSAGNYMSVPVHHTSTTLIRDVRIDYTRSWNRKLLTTLRQSYERHPFFEEFYSILCSAFERRPIFLMDLNLPLIRKVVELLELPVELVLSSDLQVDGTASDRLVSLCQQLDATHYRGGQGAQDTYEDLQAYEAAGITYEGRRFPLPSYPRWDGLPGDPGLSILDALMNHGSTGTRKIIYGNA